MSCVSYILIIRQSKDKTENLSGQMNLAPQELQKRGKGSLPQSQQPASVMHKWERKALWDFQRKYTEIYSKTRTDCKQMSERPLRCPGGGTLSLLYLPSDMNTLTLSEKTCSFGDTNKQETSQLGLGPSTQCQSLLFYHLSWTWVGKATCQMCILATATGRNQTGAQLLKGAHSGTCWMESDIYVTGIYTRSQGLSGNKHIFSKLTPSNKTE